MAKKISRFKIYLVVAVFVVVFLPSFAKYQELSYKNRKLAAQIAALKVDNKRLELEKIRLETDTSYIEKTARDKMGVVRKGEIVIRQAPGNK